MDGVPFQVQVQPTVSTTYTLISIQDATNCIVFAVPGITAVINPGNCTLCTGSLGDPIINATFGSGTGNSPPLETVIPGASTNLSYTPTSGEPPMPTPLDGTYTISQQCPSTIQAVHTGTPAARIIRAIPMVICFMRTPAILRSANSLPANLDNPCAAAEHTNSRPG